MRMVNLIKKKRDGDELSKEGIKYVIANYTNGKIPDYQASVLLMATLYQDMTNEETTNLTLVIANSSDIIDLSSLEGVKINKHSAGGIGNMTTLILAPLVTSVGMTVAKTPGRGLGYTGGTLGKLKATPEFRAKLSGEELVRIVSGGKVAVIGQSGNLTPTDKKLYALCDITATADSLSLIASSTMSEKTVAGVDAVVLDATTRDNAFMRSIEDARRLTKIMMNIGKLTNREVMVIISDMSEPLSRAVGNSLEVIRAIETLQKNGPGDLVGMYYVLGSQMIVLAGKAKATDETRTLLQEALGSGGALAKFKEMIQNQGGDPTIAKHPERILTIHYIMELPIEQSGVVSRIVASKLGIAAMVLGTGRKTKEEDIDHAVGLRLHKEISDTATEGESPLTIYSNDEGITSVIKPLYKNVEIGELVMKPTLTHDITTE